MLKAGHFRAKLTPDQVLAIRLEYAKGETTAKTLGAKYGLSHSMVRRILRGDVWKAIGGPLSKTNTENKLTENSVRAIREEYRKGKVTHSRLAEKYSVSESLIAQVVQRQTWKKVTDLDPEIIELYRAASLKPIDSNRRLSDADAAAIFGLRSDAVRP